MAGCYRFRAVREQHDFFTICRTPELACEVTLQPIRRYAGLLDASIIFSDILVVPQAIGMTVEMLPGTGPHFPNPLQSDQDAEDLLKRCEGLDVHQQLDYVYKAITLTRQRLEGQVPLIGFTGAPWTLLAYMIEGGGSKSFAKAKTWLWNKPELSHRLLQRVAEICADYLTGQIKAGAQVRHLHIPDLQDAAKQECDQAIQVFDSWAGELSPRDFAQFCQPYLKLIAERVTKQLQEASVPVVPLIVFAKGANQSLDLVCQAGYDVVGIDWTISPATARQVVAKSGKSITLQGNLDPSLLYADHSTLAREVDQMFNGEQGFGKDGCHIANLGHGGLFSFIHSYSRQLAQVRCLQALPLESTRRPCAASSKAFTAAAAGSRVVIVAQGHRDTQLIFRYIQRSAHQMQSMMSYGQR